MCVEGFFIPWALDDVVVEPQQADPGRIHLVDPADPRVPCWPEPALRDATAWPIGRWVPPGVVRALRREGQLDPRWSPPRVRRGRRRRERRRRGHHAAAPQGAARADARAVGQVEGRRRPHLPGARPRVGGGPALEGGPNPRQGESWRQRHARGPRPRARGSRQRGGGMEEEEGGRRRRRFKTRGLEDRGGGGGFGLPFRREWSFRFPGAENTTTKTCTIFCSRPWRSERGLH